MADRPSRTSERMANKLREEDGRRKNVFSPSSSSGKGESEENEEKKLASLSPSREIFTPPPPTRAPSSEFETQTRKRAHCAFDDE